MLRTLLVFVLLATAGFAEAPPDFAETKKKAEAGDGNAQFMLSWMYNNGIGVPKDPAEALKWSRKAWDQRRLAMSQSAPDFTITKSQAEAGDASAQFNLGLIYYEGLNVPKDTGEAIKWYRKAADQGIVSALFNLGEIYRLGKGDRAEALKWYRKAADQGNMYAQNVMGYSYRHGEGVPKDSAEAFKWYHKSANQGGLFAQYDIAKMYAEGEGVPKDLVQAHAWWNIAGANGYEDAKKNLAIIEKEMTDSQKEKAMDLARELFAKLPPKK
jgi:TPR repeat protein